MARQTGDPASQPGGASSQQEQRQTRPSELPKPPPKMLRPEVRRPPAPSRTSAPKSGGSGSGGVEWIPWSELSPNQRAGRSVAVVVAVFIVFFFLRGLLRTVAGGRGNANVAPANGTSSEPISDSDRKDGIESLCKVFQIYGLPKNDKDATEAAHNAAELFKLAGNQPPERSQYILKTIVGEFRGGHLGQADCTAAGAPLPTTPPESGDSSTDNAPNNNQ